MGWKYFSWKLREKLGKEIEMDVLMFYSNLGKNSLQIHGKNNNTYFSPSKQKGLQCVGWVSKHWMHSSYINWVTPMNGECADKHQGKKISMPGSQWCGKVNGVSPLSGVEAYHFYHSQHTVHAVVH